MMIYQRPGLVGSGRAHGAPSQYHYLDRLKHEEHVKTRRQLLHIVEIVFGVLISLIEITCSLLERINVRNVVNRLMASPLGRKSTVDPDTHPSQPSTDAPQGRRISNPQ